MLEPDPVNETKERKAGLTFSRSVFSHTCERAREAAGSIPMCRHWYRSTLVRGPFFTMEMKQYPRTCALVVLTRVHFIESLHTFKPQRSSRDATVTLQLSNVHKGPIK